MASLRLENVTKEFGNLQVIKGVDFAAEHGEFVVFVGPSGCGKSTMLRLITGLESVTTGRVFIDDLDVTHARPIDRGVAMVFQSYALFPHMNVADNIGFGLRLAKLPKAEIERRVAEVARILRVEDLLDRKPRQLSGGQRQRVAIGRSIIRDPKVFLFDEPLSNLDAALRVIMRLEITRLHARLDATMIYVTHDQTEAMTLADRIVVFNAGVIEQVGCPMDLYDRPANKFVAGFIGSPAMNFLEAVRDGSGEPDTLRVGGGTFAAGRDVNALVAEPITFGIRPEHVSISGSEEADLSARVEIVEELGAESMVYFQIDGSEEPLAMRTSDEVRHKPGDRVGLILDRERIHLFGPDGNSLSR